MSLYRFSPIKTEASATAALEYVHDNLRELSSLVLKEHLSIKTLKIFAHYQEEYNFLYDWSHAIGKQDKESSATSLYVEPYSPLVIKDEPIEYIGIRVPDPYRSQVGCGDFEVEDFEYFKDKYLGKSPYIREIEHSTYTMLEIFHPDFDVLAYIVKVIK